MVQLGSLKQDEFFVPEGSQNVYQVTGEYNDHVNARLMCRHSQDASDSINLDKTASISACSVEEYADHMAHGGEDPEELLRQHEEWQRKMRKDTLLFFVAGVAFMHILVGLLFWCVKMPIEEVKKAFVIVLPMYPFVAGLWWSIAGTGAKQVCTRLLLGVGAAALLIYLEHWPLHDLVRSWIHS
jgi:hypothetical protein